MLVLSRSPQGDFGFPLYIPIHSMPNFIFSNVMFFTRCLFSKHPVFPSTLRPLTALMDNPVPFLGHDLCIFGAWDVKTLEFKPHRIRSLVVLPLLHQNTAPSSTNLSNGEVSNILITADVQRTVESLSAVTRCLKNYKIQAQIALELLDFMSHLLVVPMQPVFRANYYLIFGPNSI